VRARHGNAIVLTTYGRSSGFCVDPIEKKPLNHFFPGTAVLSFGTAGCNLACKFCQNWDISKSREMETLATSAAPSTIAAVARDSGCSSVAFTYNDPVIFHEYAVDVAAACREIGIASVAVTAGYVEPAPRREFFAAMDAANVDLKAFNEKFYRELTGGRLGPVLDTLCHLRHETDVWFEITYLIIPGHNDAPAELEAMCRWLIDNLGSSIPLHFSAFHPDWKMRNVPPTSPDTLTQARRIAQAHGLHHVYTGNIHDADGGSTYCHSCGERLIERDWYQLGQYRLSADGKCPACGTVCPGRFADRPGSWGRRRMVVEMPGVSGGTGS
jgi:pyruvate formate lyase activating enzyme